MISGFGLSQTVFTPIESSIVNPSNVPPVSSNTTNTTDVYFTDPQVLENVPLLMLWLAAINTVILGIGVVLMVEKEEEEKEGGEMSLKERLGESLSYLYQEACTSKNFHVLWLTRFLHLIVGSAILANWKTFSLTLSDDDKVTPQDKVVVIP